MSKFSAAVRHVAFLVALVAAGCDDEPGPVDAGAGGTGGVHDARGVDSAGGNKSDGPMDVAMEAPAQDITPVVIQRPVVVRRGTRLRGFFVQAGEGAQERWALWDSMLNTRCSIATADDGKARCLPLLPSGWALEASFARYLDPECNVPALPEAPACTSAFGSKFSAIGRAVHRLGPAAEVTTLYSRITINGVPMCQAKTLPQPRRFFTLGEQIPTAMFVERLGVRSDGPQTQRMKPVYSEMADGTRVINVLTEVWDTDMEAYCRVVTADDGWLRCLPSVTALASTTSFADDKCTRSAGLTFSEMPEKFAALTTGTGCQARRRIFRVPPMPAALTTIYRILNERCTASTVLPGSGQYFELGEELPASRFAAFRPARVGTGRLQERYFVGEEGVAVRETGSLWDSQLNQLCTFDLTKDGRRCVPTGWGGSYADAACKNRVALPGTQLCGEPAAAAPMNTLNVGPWCAPQAEPRALIASANPPDAGTSITYLYARSLDDSCTQTATGSTGYRDIGDAVDVNMFVPGTEGMD